MILLVGLALAFCLAQVEACPVTREQAKAEILALLSQYPELRSRFNATTNAATDAATNTANNSGTNTIPNTANNSG